MTIRRGISAPASIPSTQQSRDAQPHAVIGRQVAKSSPPEPVRQASRIIQNSDRNSSVRAVFQDPPPLRGLLVDATGKPLRGLSQATIKAHQDHTENATELCTRCGEMRPPAAMKQVTGNAENPNNALRVCKIECTPQMYKNPYADNERWQASVPAVRFDRETGQPYNAHSNRVNLSDLVNKDTYHREQDVDADKRQIADHGAGQWSGRMNNGRIGHVPTRRR